MSVHSDFCINISNITAPSGEPEDVRTVSLSPISFLLEWDPPLEEDRNGVLTGYRLVLEWEVGHHILHTVLWLPTQPLACRTFLLQGIPVYVIDGWSIIVLDISYLL